MDDAVARTTTVSTPSNVKETIAGNAAGNYIIDLHGHRRRRKQRYATDHRDQDTTAPEFTFVPADYTVECSDEMPMDDATASDNCGEVTIQFKRSDAGDVRATTPSRARSRPPTTLETAALRPNNHRRTPLLSSPSSLPTTP